MLSDRMKFLIILVLAAIIAELASGCSAMQEMTAEEKEAWKTRVYQTDYKIVYNLMLDAFDENLFPIEESDIESGWIKTAYNEETIMPFGQVDIHYSCRVIEKEGGFVMIKLTAVKMGTRSSGSRFRIPDAKGDRKLYDRIFTPVDNAILLSE